MVSQTQLGNRWLSGSTETKDDDRQIERRLDLMLRLANSLETLHDIRIDESLRQSTQKKTPGNS